ncbi:MAG: prepilin-type N-terminal cleavage/methylation domain-containing protein [Planctomycetes bacterium]|nr:prepilin-type N-terminal cleavage/methylation domain-containing protein [Planctomycetota bacterium]
MKRNFILKNQRAFSLAEVIIALTISAMIMVAVLTIYSRAESSASAITRQINKSRLPSEVLQRIAEDIDQIISPDKNIKITIENKNQNGYPGARLTILKTFYDKKNKKQTFERIVWQSSYDYETDVDGLIIYRSHSGVAPEDKLLGGQKEKWERELFVPICNGVTFFRIQVLVGDDLQNRWTSEPLPKAIAATISFAEPFKTLTGAFDVLDTEKTRRTIVIDRVRKIKFALPKD